MPKKRTIVIPSTLMIVFIFVLELCSAQTQTKEHKYSSLVVKPQLGYIIPTNDFVRGENNTNEQMSLFQSTSLQMLWQTPDSSKWKMIYQAPYYGVGTMVSNYFNAEEVGVPVSLYGVLGIPITRMQKLELYSELQFGIAYGWQPYDLEKNPNNIALGGRITAHVSAGFNLLYPITKSLDLGLGVNLLHFSNGGIERPNQGLNVFASSIDIKYHLNGRAPIHEIADPGKLDRTHYLYVMTGFGIHQIYNNPEHDEHYLAYGVGVHYFNQLANAFRLGYGTDINYWQYQDQYLNKESGESISIGLAISPEVMIGDLVLAGSVGIYALNSDYGNFQKPYQRLGLRYDFENKVSAGFHIRSINFGKAEFLEFTCGLKIY